MYVVLDNFSELKDVTTLFKDFTRDNFLSSGILWTLNKTKNQLAEEMHKVNLIKVPSPKVL